MTYLFYSWKSVPFDLLQLILPSPSSPAFGNHQSVLYVFCCVLFFRLHICDIIQYLSFSVRLILLGTVPLRSVHAVTNGEISFFFNSWIVFQHVCVCVCVCVSHLLYWWYSFCLHFASANRLDHMQFRNRFYPNSSGCFLSLILLLI